MYGPDFSTSIFVLLGIIAVFFIFRGIFLWYWKVNTIVRNQEKTNELLQKLVDATISKDLSTDDASVKEAPVTGCSIPETYSPSDELVIVINATGEEKIWKMKEWDVAVKYGNEGRFTPKEFIKK